MKKINKYTLVFRSAVDINNIFKRKVEKIYKMCKNINTYILI